MSYRGAPCRGQSDTTDASAVVVVALPLLQLLQSLFVFQTVFGNYPMLVRWQFHRHLLGQSLAFFQDEFAGRVSQKVMQTALLQRSYGCVASRFRCY